MNKILEEEKNLLIRFTEEEIEELNLKKDWKYSVTMDDDKIVLTPYSEIEIDLEELDKEVLIHLLQLSAKNNWTIHEVIEYVLGEMIND
jgi:hypothetical protein